MQIAESREIKYPSDGFWVLLCRWVRDGHSCDVALGAGSGGDFDILLSAGLLDDLTGAELLRLFAPELLRLPHDDVSLCRLPLLEQLLLSTSCFAKSSFGHLIFLGPRRGEGALLDPLLEGRLLPLAAASCACSSSSSVRAQSNALLIRSVLIS